MEKFLYFFVHLGVPVFILLFSFIFKAKSIWGLISNLLFKLSLLLFLYLWGQYPLTGTYYLRYVLLLIALIVLVNSVRNRGSRQLRPVSYRYLLSGVVLLISVFIFMQCVNALKGKFEIEFASDLTFPLINGQYYISSGGGTSIINNHLRSQPTSQQYAIDINKMGSIGSASSNVFSSKAEKHFIYGELVYCPCDGKVIDVRNDVPDNEKTGMYVDHSFGRGNFIDLDCSGLIVSMSHFKIGSVQVKKGDFVTRGQPIARVGNSGFSQEPHLHIQGARYLQDSLLIGVPVKFNGRWLVRNDVITLP